MMAARATAGAAELLRRRASAAPAPEGTSAVLLVDFSTTTCSHCRLPAFPHQETHADLAGLGPSDRRGCLARFTAITSVRRLDDDWRRALTEMRRDLPIVDYRSVLRGDLS